MNDLLLPIVKGYGSEKSYEQLAQALQIFGGSGFLQDYPIEQYIRDAKIDSLYEGTTAIQSLDLFFRKIVKDGGVALNTLNGEIGKFLAAESGGEDIARERRLLADAQAEVGGMLKAMLDKAGESLNDPKHALRRRAEHGPPAVRPRRRDGGLAAPAPGGRGRRRARGRRSGRDVPFYTGKVAAAKFFARQILPLHRRAARDRRGDRQLADGAAGGGLLSRGPPGGRGSPHFREPPLPSPARGGRVGAILRPAVRTPGELVVTFSLLVGLFIGYQLRDATVVGRRHPEPTCRSVRTGSAALAARTALAAGGETTTRSRRRGHHEDRVRGTLLACRQKRGRRTHGDRTAPLRFFSLSAYLSNSSGTVQATVTNTGNLLQTPKAHLRATGLFGTLPGSPLPAAEDAESLHLSQSTAKLGTGSRSPGPGRIRILARPRNTASQAPKRPLRFLRRMSRTRRRPGPTPLTRPRRGSPRSATPLKGMERPAAAIRAPGGWRAPHEALSGPHEGDSMDVPPRRRRAEGRRAPRGLSATLAARRAVGQRSRSASSRATFAARAP